jgi:hypothetical protein
MPKGLLAQTATFEPEGMLLKSRTKRTSSRFKNWQTSARLRSEKPAA